MPQNLSQRKVVFLFITLYVVILVSLAFYKFRQPYPEFDFQRPYPKLDIHFVGTESYAERAGTFKLTFRDAVLAKVNHDRGPDGSGETYGAMHYVILNDEFVFAMMEKARISLSGTYVNGNTGEVTMRQGPMLTLDEADRMGYVGQKLVGNRIVEELVRKGIVNRQPGREKPD